MELALQLLYRMVRDKLSNSHNPCFYGISFAIKKKEKKINDFSRHNPCFYGISFAIRVPAVIPRYD